MLTAIKAQIYLVSTSDGHKSFGGVSKAHPAETKYFKQ